MKMKMKWYAVRSFLVCQYFVINFFEIAMACCGNGNKSGAACCTNQIPKGENNCCNLDTFEAARHNTEVGHLRKGPGQHVVR